MKRSLTILWIWLVLSVGVCTYLCISAYPDPTPTRGCDSSRHGFFPSMCRRSCVLHSAFSVILVIASVHPSRCLQLLNARNQVLPSFITFIATKPDARHAVPALPDWLVCRASLPVFFRRAVSIPGTHTTLPSKIIMQRTSKPVQWSWQRIWESMEKRRTSKKKKKKRQTKKKVKRIAKLNFSSL